ncbi:MAG: T9SS type A sorting domain-containing protein [Candidatus Delongbacteria bacterium]|nr:T9SS type A sorting domain-containing protein [Candidatus Delongbacteria bacterium]
MKRIYLIILVFVAVLFSQYEGITNIPLDYITDVSELNGQTKGEVNITLVFGEFDNLRFDTTWDFTRADTNQTYTYDGVLQKQWYPAMMSIPINNDPNELESQSLREYLQDHPTLSIYEYMEAAIPDFFDNMSKGELQVNVTIIKNPERADGLWEIGNTSLYGTNFVNAGNAIVTTINQYYKDTYNIDNFMGDYDRIQRFVPRINWGVSAYSSGYLQLNTNFNESVALLAHELGHSILRLGDKGNDNLYNYSLIPSFDGYIDGDFMGRSFTLTGAYDLMYHNSSIPGPYTLYGLYPFHTNDLINLDYIEVPDIESINEGTNKLNLKLKAVREILEDAERANGDRSVIKIPITIDDGTGDYSRPSGSGVESQFFLVEYRNGKGYDEFSCLDHQGESKGVLISHIINSDSHEPTIDIEIAQPYQKYWSNGVDLFRDPDSSRTNSNGTPIIHNGLNENGTYYCSKKDVDWMDDLDRNVYLPLAGRYAYWRAPTAPDAASLPTDFFTSKGSNKFTPTTYPSTDSWKLQDSHIAVYMNGEDGEFADVTVYRNYWSKPILASSTETISGEGYIGENLTVETGAILTLDANSIVSIIPNTNMIVQSGAKLVLLDGSTLGIEDGAKILLEPGAIVEVNGNVKIAGDFTVGSNAVVDIKEGGTLSLVFAETTVGSGGNIKLNAESKLINLNGSRIVFEDGSLVESSKGAEIVVMTKGYFTADGATFSYIDESGTWMGINAISGSSIELENVTINGAETAVKGMGNYEFDVTNSNFEGCINGIDLVGMNPGYAYSITDNIITGVDDGRGISITSSDGIFSRNVVSHFNTGVYFIMSSPAVSKCDISYNKYFGMIISGHDAIPQLINTEQMQAYGELNCTIEKNGYVSNTSLFPSGNIGIIPVGSIYMRNNDVYSSPRFPGISIAQLYVPNSYVTINAQYNYWGAEEINDDFFFGHTQYTIDYTPYNSSPGGGGIIPTSMQDVSTESRLLSSALNLETKDKDIPAIKLYENIIRKYEDSPEYYVAMARLPYLYEKAELDNSELIKIYDEAIESENTSHKKFFKGKKVATHIKGKRYDDAITIAEEMKDEAEIEEEIILADINIAIANMFKDLESEGKSRSSVDHSSNISDLLAKLNGDDNTGEKTDITEPALPTEFTLYQNYPNPFNPTTEISYALSQDANVSIKIYSSNGSIVADLVNASQSVGQHSVTFDASKLSNGIFYYSLVANGRVVSTKKMLLLK